MKTIYKKSEINAGRAAKIIRLYQSPCNKSLERNIKASDIDKIYPNPMQKAKTVINLPLLFVGVTSAKIVVANLFIIKYFINTVRKILLRK